MGFKELIKNAGQKGNARKELLNRMSEQVRLEGIVAERQLSSNERELNRLRKEKREEAIKEELDFRRKERDDDIKFGHNPLDTENIIAKKQWEVLREPNQFSKKSNMFTNKDSIMKNNPNLLKTNHNLLKGGGMFKI